jgi:hypothetical protein
MTFEGSNFYDSNKAFVYGQIKADKQLREGITPKANILANTYYADFKNRNQGMLIAVTGQSLGAEIPASVALMHPECIGIIINISI